MYVVLYREKVKKIIAIKNINCFKNNLYLMMLNGSLRILFQYIYIYKKFN